MTKKVIITDITKTPNKENIPKTDGNYFNHFQEKTLKNIIKEDKDNIINSTIRILSNCVKSNFSDDSEESNTGIVIGKIQSGKTLSFTGVISLAIDNGYRIVFILAGTKKLLENQTYERIKKALSIKGEDELRFVGNEAQKDIEDALRYEKTIVIPILKHQKQISHYTQILNSQKIKNYLKKASVLIFDDEADQASLNTQERKNAKQGLNNESTIFKTINDLRKTIPNHSFIQYTATPQANLLISRLNTLSPEWHEVLRPGSKYTGGDIFFKNKEEYVREIIPELDPITNNYFPPETKHLKRPPKSLKNAIREFLVLASLKFKRDELNPNLKETPDWWKKSTMMIHPTHLVNDNKKEEKGIKKFYNWTENILKAIEDEIDDNDFRSFKVFYDEIKESIEPKKIFNIFPGFDEVMKILSGKIMSSCKSHQVIGGYLKKGEEFQWDIPNNHILVGGSILDRGFTVENLIMTYMPRDTKSKNQADTIEQRCRFYGYRSDYIDFCRVYITENMINDLKNYNKSENYLTEFLSKNSLEEFYNSGCKMLMDNNLIATNVQRLRDDLFSTRFKGWLRFEPQFEMDKYKKNNRTIDLFDNNILSALKPKEIFPKNPTDDNTHLLYKIDIEKISTLILKLEMNELTDQDRIFDLYSLFNKIRQSKKYCYFLKIAHKRKYRERTVYKNKGKYSVQLFTGRIGGEDRKMVVEKGVTTQNIPYDNEVVIQLHHIFSKIKDDPYNEEQFKTLAIYIPEKHAENYIRKYD